MRMTIITLSSSWSSISSRSRPLHLRVFLRRTLYKIDYPPRSSVLKVTLGLATRRSSRSRDFKLIIKMPEFVTLLRPEGETLG